MSNSSRLRNMTQACVPLAWKLKIIRLRLGAKNHECDIVKKLFNFLTGLLSFARGAPQREGIKKLTAPKISFDFSRALNIHESGFTTSKKSFFSLFSAAGEKSCSRHKIFLNPTSFFAD